MASVNFFVRKILILLVIFSRDNGQFIREETRAIQSGKVIPFKESRLRLSHPMDRIFKKTQRIVGGHLALPHQYPYQVAIHVKKHSGKWSLCGGTLLTTEYILTAAHCVANAESTKVFLGAHEANIYSTEPYARSFETTTFIIHKDYGGANSGINDIALIRLPEKVVLNKNIATVKLAQGTDNYVGRSCVCVGWGTTAIGKPADVLKYVDLEVITNKKCKNYGFEDNIQDYHICAIGDGSNSPCAGDSGGPLIINNTQVGVVSFGDESCIKGMPSVFIRVSKFTSWIMENSGQKKLARASGNRIAPHMEVFLEITLCVIYL